MMVVLPPPVGPTKAATCPGSIVKLTSSRIDLVRTVPERHVVEFDGALERGAPDARARRSRTPPSVSSTSRIRSNPTLAFDTVSVIFDRSRIGLYIFPR